MKKLKLNLEQLNNAQVLTRSQLRNVLGGGGGETTAPDCGDASTYCGIGSGVSCCPGYSCVDAGNAKGHGTAESKICEWG